MIVYLGSSFLFGTNIFRPYYPKFLFSEGVKTQFNMYYKIGGGLFFFLWEEATFF